MQVSPNCQEGYDLLHQGAIAMAKMEYDGICIDVPYLEKAMERTQRRIARITSAMEDDEVMKAWRKAYGKSINFDAREQLADVLYSKLGYAPTRTTKGGKASVDEEALSDLGCPFVDDYLEVMKLKKAIGTNLKGLLKEVVAGKLHAFFNLHTTITYRGSSDSINFQNQPLHDPDVGELVRRAFIARPGRQLVEIDISGAEVRTGACYHHDPVMVDYILDKSKDMHRDMAMQIFSLPLKEITKLIRFHVKGKFVFAQFYGDFYISCARSLWKHAVNDPECKTTSGITLKDHLAGLGVRELGELDTKIDPPKGTFERVLRDVEKDFWGRRFKVYASWKRKWYEDYQKKGWFSTLTGFACRGYMRRNEAVNYPIQGSAFHCILWAVIELVNKELEKRGMKSLVVGQIHDSIVADVVPSEMADFLALCHKIIVVDLRKHWPWLVVPIEVEAEAAPVGGSWADKVKVELPS